MSHRGRALIAAVVAVVAVTGLVAVVGPRIGAPTAPPASTAATTSVWGLPPGRSVWSLRCVAESQLGGAVPGQTLVGAAVWRGPVALQAGKDGRSVTLTVLGIDEARLDVAGSALLSSQQARSLIGREVTWIVDAHGAVVDTIGRGVAGPALVLLRQLGGELQVPLATTSTWTTAVQTARGRGRIEGHRDADGQVTLRRGAYDAVAGIVDAADVLVEGTVHVTFDDDGHLQGLDGDETVAGLDDSGAVRDVLRATVSLKPLAPGDVIVETAVLDAPVSLPSMASPSPLELAARRAALLADLDRQLVTGFQLDGHAAFRALVDALERDDRLVDDVARRFARAPGRITDVLVAAGTPAAQRALLALLDDDKQSGDIDGDLVQRLAFLRRPEAETLRFLGRVAGADHVDGGDARTATTPARLALGALAGRGLHDERAEVRREAERALQALRALVDDDDLDAGDRAVALRALGNSGGAARHGAGEDAVDDGDIVGALDADDTARVIAHAADDDARVRAAAAAALRHGDGEAAQAALLQLAADDAARVQASALQALASHLDERALLALADLAGDGGIDRENAGRVVTLVRSRLDEPAARAALEAVIADARTDPFTEGMARDLLDTTAPAP